MARRNESAVFKRWLRLLIPSDIDSAQRLSRGTGEPEFGALEFRGGTGMRRWFSVLALLALTISACFVLGPIRTSGAAANACDRSCLNGFVDRYLAALVAHDPSRLPLARNVKYTE